jgi:hypothetical protein
MADAEVVRFEGQPHAKTQRRKGFPPQHH